MLQQGLVLQKEREQLRTTHETVFQNCIASFGCIVRDPAGVPVIHEIVITDPAENHIYRYRFPEAGRDELITLLHELGRVVTHEDPDVPNLTIVTDRDPGDEVA
jgi:hypothetical protein